MPHDPDHRDAEEMRRTLMAQWRALATAKRPCGPDLWIFAYGSLIWMPEFDFVERRKARVYGHHRALSMWSTVHRGTREVPGLVLALVTGGSCWGVAYRIECHQAERALEQVWHREMPIPVYDPCWLKAHTDQGPVCALAFTLSRHSPHFTGELSDERMRKTLQTARGGRGTTAEYVRNTHEHLREWGIQDAHLARWAHWAAARAA